MQIVGKTCEICGERVTLAPDAEGCLSCKLVFHRDCLSRQLSPAGVWDKTARCPRCQKSFAAQVAVESREEKRAARQLLRRGRHLTVAVVILCVIITLLTLFSFLDSVAGNTREETEEALDAEGLGHIIRGSLYVSAIYFLYRGREWARGIVAAVLGVGGVLVVLVSTKGALELETSSLLMTGLGLASLGACWLLVFSESVKAFLLHQKRRLGNEATDLERYLKMD